MNKLRVGVLFSGVGSTTKSICEAIKHNILDIDLQVILTNNTLDNIYFKDNADVLGYNLYQIISHLIQNLNTFLLNRGDLKMYYKRYYIFLKFPILIRL